LLNVLGYYDRLLEFLHHAETERFIRSEHLSVLLTDTEPEGLLRRFEIYQPPQVEKRLNLKTQAEAEAFTGE